MTFLGLVGMIDPPRPEAKAAIETCEQAGVYTLVFPEDADITEGKISVLAPIGTPMLGYRVGDTFARNYSNE